MEANPNKKLNTLRRIQAIQSQSAERNRVKIQNNNRQFSSRRGTVGTNPVDRRNYRRKQFGKPVNLRGYNRVQAQPNKIQQALITRQQRRQQLKRQQLQEQHSQLDKWLKLKNSNPRMKPGASTIYGSGDQPSKRYTIRLNQGGDHPPSYNSPPNVMQNHYDKEYSNTFNDPFPAPPTKPFDPPNIFSQGHPGETRYWEQNFGPIRRSKLGHSGKNFKIYLYHCYYIYTIHNIIPNIFN